MTATPDVPWSPLVNPRPITPARYERLAGRVGSLLGSRNHDVLLVPGEAIVALEAAAREAGASGKRFLNVATSTYGHLFGQWLSSSGAYVRTLEPSVPGQPIDIATIEAALTSAPWDGIAFVHGEAASGIVNPLSEILQLARLYDVTTLVDAVASWGAEPIDLKNDDIDIVVVGAQKALGGPSGISAVAINERGWALLSKPVDAPHFSSLSLLDIKRDWLDTDRSAIPGTPLTHDLWVLDAALSVIEEEGIAEVVARHRTTALAVRAGIAGLGLRAWAPHLERASGLVTGVVVPEGIRRADVLALALDRYGVQLGVTPAGVDGQVVRILHTGRQATFATAMSSITALGGAITALGGQIDIGAGTEAVLAAYDATP